MLHNLDRCLFPPIKLSLVTRHFGVLGGIEKHSLRLALAFANQGAEVHILTADSMKENTLHPLLHFHTLPIKKRINFRKIKEFDSLCQNWHQQQKMGVIFGMDRIRSQTHLRAGNGVHAAFLKQKKMFASFKKPFFPLITPLDKILLNIEKESFESNTLKRIFTNSHRVKKEILTYYKTASEKIEVIHNGVEWKEMETDFKQAIEKKSLLCSHLNLNPDVYHFLFIGNGFKRKGLLFLLKALSLLPFKDFHLSVVGKDKHLKRFVMMTHFLNLKNQVTFFGKRSDVRIFYQYADCLVIPSLYDPFANVTVEALAMGLYVITSPFNGGHEVITKESGLLIENLKDPKIFGATLMEAISHPKTKRSSQNIRNSIKHLDFSYQLKKLIQSTFESLGT